MLASGSGFVCSLLFVLGNFHCVYAMHMGAAAMTEMHLCPPASVARNDPQMLI